MILQLNDNNVQVVQVSVKNVSPSDEPPQVLSCFYCPKNVYIDRDIQAVVAFFFSI